MRSWPSCGSPRRSPVSSSSPSLATTPTAPGTRLGRRRPYFLAGAILTSVALLGMPHSLGAVDGRRNALGAGRQYQYLHGAVPRVRGGPVARSATGPGLCHADLLHRRGRGGGGLLALLAGERGRQQRGHRCRRNAIADTVRYSFFSGAAVLFVALLWTVLSTREYPPTELHGFADATAESEVIEPGRAARARKRGAVWLCWGSQPHFGVAASRSRRRCTYWRAA